MRVASMILACSLLLPGCGLSGPIVMGGGTASADGERLRAKSEQVPQAVTDAIFALFEKRMIVPVGGMFVIKPAGAANHYTFTARYHTKSSQDLPARDYHYLEGAYNAGAISWAGAEAPEISAAKPRIVKLLLATQGVRITEQDLKIKLGQDPTGHKLFFYCIVPLGSTGRTRTYSGDYENGQLKSVTYADSKPGKPNPGWSGNEPR